MQGPYLLVLFLFCCGCFGSYVSNLPFIQKYFLFSLSGDLYTYEEQNWPTPVNKYQF